MLLQANLLIGYWGNAVLYAAQILNATPRTEQMKSPLEVLFHKKPDFNKFRAFGCLAFRHKNSKSGFGEKSERCIFLGLNNRKFKLKSLLSNRIFETANADFDDTKFPKSIKPSVEKKKFITFTVPKGVTFQNPSLPGIRNPTPTDIAIPTPPSSPPPSHESSTEDDVAPNANERNLKDSTPEDSESDKSSDPPESPPCPPGRRPSFDSGYSNSVRPDKFNQERQQPGYQEKYGQGKQRSKSIKALIMKIQGEDPDPETAPKSFRQARSSKFWDKWEAPIKKEYEALTALNTWELIPRANLPKDATIHNPVWKMKIKDNGRKKARLCFNSFFQEHGVDFFDTFSPVARYEGVHIVLHLVFSSGGKAKLGDIPNVFINSEVDAKVFMNELEGFKTDDSMVCRLLRNLYGMKQASRCWHKDINDFLITTMRMKSLSSTHCIYLKRLSESDWLVIILYVDDLLICSNIDEAIEEAFRQLGKWKIR